MKRQIRFSLLAVALILVTLALPAAGYAAGTPTALVNTSALNVREGPGTGYSVISVAHDGDELLVSGRSADGWLQVSLAGGKSGWVSGSYVTLSGDANSLALVSAPAAASKAVMQSGSNAGHLIVFQQSSGGPIYVVNPDGSNLRYLTTGIDPALSPDGKQVAFTRWQGESNGAAGSLWVINVDGTGERQITFGANQAKSPTWSSDGSKIIINLQAGGTLDDTYLCMVNGQPVEMPQPIAGQRCMRQRADPFWGLRMVDVASGAYEDLPRERHSFAPTWDPANAWHVVFRGDKGLESLDLNQETTWVIKANGAYRGPVFSPDGSKLAVTFKQNDHWEVHVMNADASGEVRLTETPSTIFIDALLQGKTAQSWNNAAPAWSPDGSQIAFVSDRSGQYELWVMNADGSNQHVLVPASVLGAAIKYDGDDERVISWR